jgi:hypothetical protein
VAANALNEGDTIVHVPLSCVITNTDFKAQLEALPGQLKHVGDVALALALLAAQSAGTHCPYVASLPTPADFAACLPSWWPAEERAALLRGSPLLREVEDDVASFDHDWALLRGAGVTTAGAAQVTRGDLQWALAVVTSRAFTMDSGASCLVPGVDVMNHRRPRMTSYTISEDGSAGGGGMKVVALQTVAAGAEVAITYGAKGNSQLLRHYGFTVAANTEPDGSSNDVFPLRFAPDPRPSRKRKGDDAAETGGDLVVELRLASSLAPKHYTFGPFTKCLDACRVLSLTTPSSAGGKLEVRHARTEVAALECLAARLQDADARYSGPPPLPCSHEARRADCARVVASERRTLRFYTTVAATAAAILRNETSSPRGDPPWKAAALAALAAADAAATETGGSELDPLLAPLCTISGLVRTYLQIKFGVKLEN